MADDDLLAADDAEAPGSHAGDDAPTGGDDEAGMLGDAGTVRGPEQQGLTPPD